MIRSLFPFIALGFISLAVAADAKPEKKKPTPIGTIDLKRSDAVKFDKEILPLFAAKCQACHAGKIVEGKLDLTTYASLMKGGDHGVMIVPSKPADSYLFQRAGHISGPVMPPKNDGDPFTREELSLLKLWIEQGAKPPASDEKIVRKVALQLPSAVVKPVRALALQADGSKLYASRGNRLFAIDAKKGDVLAAWSDPEVKGPDAKPAGAAHVSLVESMVLSPDGKTLATGSFREVTLWDTVTGKPTKRLTGFADRVVALAFSPNGKTLATAGGAPTEEGEVKLIEIESGSTKELKSPHSDTAYAVAYSPDGTKLATGGSDKFVKVFDVATMQLLKSFEGHTNHVLDLAWSTDGKKLISCGADTDKMLKVWDYEKGEKVRDVTTGKMQATRMAVLGKANQFLLASGDGSAKLWNSDGGAGKNYDGAKDFLYAVAASADGKTIATGGEEGLIRLYGGDGGQLVKTIESPEETPAAPKKK